jgi:streptogramin lyase
MDPMKIIPPLAFCLILATSLARAAEAADLATEILLGNDAPESGLTPPPDDSAMLSPFGIDFDRNGDAFIVELEGGRVHRLAPDGAFATIAGEKSTKAFAGDGGPATGARFNGMHNVAIGQDGSVYIADTWNHCIRRIDGKTGIVSTFAGTGGTSGFSGDVGPAKEALFHDIMCVSFNPAKDALYLADIGNRRIRRIDMASGIVTTIAGNGEKAAPADGAPAAESPLVDPRAVAVSASGDIYILERGGHALRVVSTDGTIRTVAGSGKKGYADGTGTQSMMSGPKHLCFDDDGTVLIADEENACIRRFEPKTGTLTTILGRGHGTPERNLHRPHGVTLHDGKLIIVDSGHARILREK